MKKNKALIASLVLVFAIVICGALVARTYAKYVSTVTPSASEATVAKWSFGDDNQNATFTFALDHTYDANTLLNGRIAPGTSGSFAIDITNNSEVGLQYTIALTKTGVPTNVKFYSDAAHQNELTNDTLTGTIAQNAAQKTVTATVYWDWAYNTTNGDQADTTNGEAGGASGTKMTVSATVTGTQLQPTYS